MDFARVRQLLVKEEYIYRVTFGLRRLRIIAYIAGVSVCYIRLMLKGCFGPKPKSKMQNY